jgi:tight adherence protein C
MASIPSEILLALVAAFLSVALVTGFATFSFLSRRSLTQRRLHSMGSSASAEHTVLGGSLTVGRDPLLARWSRVLPKSVSSMSRLERRLANAGFTSPAVTVVFAVLELLLPVLFGVAALVWLGFGNRMGWGLAALAGAIGYLLPGLYLDYKLAGRRKQIRNGLPDLLDLLIVCLEAGSSLDQAIVKASEELSLPYPALAKELRLLTTETRAGKPRLEAFRNLAQRTKVEDVRTLVSMLAQTDRYGTSVAQTLRTMAEEMRTKRRQAAEEMAAKVAVKLVFPLVFCLFPALYVVMLGPAMIQFTRNFPR